jgi:hypothetical protein
MSPSFTAATATLGVAPIIALTSPAARNAWITGSRWRAANS